MSALTAEGVEQAFVVCQSDLGDIEVDMIVGKVKFDSAKVEENSDAIAALLLDLPDQFMESGGGGWSFLNACMDRDDNQWTGLHLTMGKLFALGQAAGMVTCQMPREMWDLLPGGMPYYVVNDKSFGRL